MKTKFSKYILCMFLMLFSLPSCKDLKAKREMLQGNWQCVSLEGSGDFDGFLSKVSLSFAKNQYVYKSVNYEENGRFAIENDIIWFIKSDGYEKQIGLDFLSNDSLRIRMNADDKERVMVFKKK